MVHITPMVLFEGLFCLTYFILAFGIYACMIPKMPQCNLAAIRAAAAEMIKELPLLPRYLCGPSHTLLNDPLVAEEAFETVPVPGCVVVQEKFTVTDSKGIQKKLLKGQVWQLKANAAKPSYTKDLSDMFTCKCARPVEEGSHMTRDGATVEILEDHRSKLLFGHAMLWKHAVRVTSEAMWDILQVPLAAFCGLVALEVYPPSLVVVQYAGMALLVLRSKAAEAKLMRTTAWSLAFKDPRKGLLKASKAGFNAALSALDTIDGWTHGFAIAIFSSKATSAGAGISLEDAIERNWSYGASSVFVPLIHRMSFTGVLAAANAFSMATQLVMARVNVSVPLCRPSENARAVGWFCLAEQASKDEERVAGKDGDARVFFKMFLKTLAESSLLLFLQLSGAMGDAALTGTLKLSVRGLMIISTLALMKQIIAFMCTVVRWLKGCECSAWGINAIISALMYLLLAKAVASFFLHKVYMLWTCHSHVGSFAGCVPVGWVTAACIDSFNCTNFTDASHSNGTITHDWVSERVAFGPNSTLLCLNSTLFSRANCCACGGGHGYP